MAMLLVHQEYIFLSLIGGFYLNTIHYYTNTVLHANMLIH